MVSLPTIFSGLMVILTYLIIKQQTLKSTAELQGDIEKRLQPKYSVNEPLNSHILPHTEWPSGDFYFEVWHVEVYETGPMKWRKWLPLGNTRGRTIIQYRLYGAESPSQKELLSHHLAVQPYVNNIDKDPHDPEKIKVNYDSVNPEDISLFVTQFKYLIRDTMFYHLNPDVDIQYEVIKGDDGGLYARFFDANIADEMFSNDPGL